MSDQKELRCTYPRCRQVVPHGSGVQIQRADGTTDRFCHRCWLRYCDERVAEQAIRQSCQDAADKHAEAVADHYENRL